MTAPRSFLRSFDGAESAFMFASIFGILFRIWFHEY